MKVIKERIVALLGKFHVVAKTCKKILVLRGNPMERFKDAQSTSSVPRMISISFLLIFSTHCQVMKDNAN